MFPRSHSNLQISVVFHVFMQDLEVRIFFRLGDQVLIFFCKFVINSTAVQLYGKTFIIAQRLQVRQHFELTLSYMVFS